MAEPQWVKEFKATKPGQVKPITENMQRKMNGSVPEKKDAKTK